MNKSYPTECQTYPTGGFPHPPAGMNQIQPEATPAEQYFAREQEADVLSGIAESELDSELRQEYIKLGKILLRREIKMKRQHAEEVEMLAEDGRKLRESWVDETFVLKSDRHGRYEV